LVVSPPVLFLVACGGGAGDWNPERIIILEFPTTEQMQRWRSSPEYLELAPLRMLSTKARAIALEGYSPSAR
jgi:uncharacterized protein (DUF1330 family)